mmetsp:Transcript_18814/g.49916  ORF Transcript_18814/g.49916 Transcript_18814/m.49916 type:complete len:249 (-) Transcript_18814:398-1144(-)
MMVAESSHLLLDWEIIKLTRRPAQESDGTEDFPMVIKWYYRPEDEQDLPHAPPEPLPQELVSSTHKDKNYLDCVISKCWVFSSEMFARHNLSSKPNVYLTRWIFVPSVEELLFISETVETDHCISRHSDSAVIQAALDDVARQGPARPAPREPAEIAREVVGRHKEELQEMLDAVAGKMAAEEGVAPAACRAAALKELLDVADSAQAAVEEFYRGFRKNSKEPTFEEVMSFFTEGGLEAKLTERASRR